MSVQKDKNGTWRVQYSYIDFTGKRKQSQKRGFKTKKEAVLWEAEQKRKTGSRLNMSFSSFFDLYAEYRRPRIKDSTWDTKEHMVRTKILPYFGERKLDEITATDVLAWQNTLMEYRDEKGEPYSVDYLRTIHAQLSAVFNFAVNFYGLPSNPAKKAGNMGKEVQKEMQFWVKEEYLKFAREMMDKPRSYYAFEMLYWTGIREGELLALTPMDFDLEAGTVRITKTYHRKNGEDIITSPKTPQSYRTVLMPKFLVDEMKDYISHLYECREDQRIFEFTKYYLDHEMKRGCNASGVKEIRIHDLRHSHVSLLIHMGFSALAIGKRVGHTAEKITYRYAHLFPTVQTEMVKKLEIEFLTKEEEI